MLLNAIIADSGVQFLSRNLPKVVNIKCWISSDREYFTRCCIAICLPVKTAPSQNGPKSKRPQVKTAPSQNGPKSKRPLVKTAPNQIGYCLEILLHMFVL